MLNKVINYITPGVLGIAVLAHLAVLVDSFRFESGESNGSNENPELPEDLGINDRIEV